MNLLLHYAKCIALFAGGVCACCAWLMGMVGAVAVVGIALVIELIRLKRDK